MTCLHPSQEQGNRLFQDGYIDTVPNISCGGKLSNFLSDVHVFWKNRSKDSVFFFPLFVVCKAYKKFWARTNPRNRTPSYGWANLSWNLLKYHSLGIKCSLNQCKRRTKRSLANTQKNVIYWTLRPNMVLPQSIQTSNLGSTSPMREHRWDETA